MNNQKEVETVNRLIMELEDAIVCLINTVPLPLPLSKKEWIEASKIRNCQLCNKEYFTRKINITDGNWKVVNFDLGTYASLYENVRPSKGEPHDIFIEGEFGSYDGGDGALYFKTGPYPAQRIKNLYFLLCSQACRSLIMNRLKFYGEESAPIWEKVRQSKEKIKQVKLLLKSQGFYPKKELERTPLLMSTPTP